MSSATPDGAIQHRAANMIRTFAVSVLFFMTMGLMAACFMSPFYPPPI
jgi:hypothetical protein